MTHWDKVHRVVSRWTYLRSRARSHTDAGELAILPRCGLGDYYIVSALVSEFESTHSFSVKVLSPENRRAVVAAFLPLEKVIPIEAKHAKGIAGLRGIWSHSLYFAHFYPGELDRLLGRGLTFVSAYRHILKLPQNTKLRYPSSITESVRSRAQEFLRLQNVAAGAYVLVCPGATTTPTSNSTEWINQLRINCRLSGLTLAWNSVPVTGILDDELLWDCLDLELIRALGGLARMIVSVRSGLCEWLSACSVPQVILYADSPFHRSSLWAAARLTEFPEVARRREALICSRTDYNALFSEASLLFK